MPEPSTIKVSLAVPVAETGAPTTATNDRLFEALSARTESRAGDGSRLQTSAFQLPTSAGEVTRLLDSRGFALGFGVIFLIGLALNLTPCVYPMLSVTVSLFGGQEETNPLRAFGKASLYVAGIVTMYSGLGVLAAYTGQLFDGWLQSAWVTVGIGALLVVLAASMFGAFELQLPASVQTRLGNAQRAAGPTGTYLSGLLVGVIAAPCIGPPVIAVLAFVGREGDPALGLATMSVMALGLGLPYLILGTFSGLLARLPQSGTWMVQAKKIFGLVLLGAGGSTSGSRWRRTGRTTPSRQCSSLGARTWPTWPSEPGPVDFPSLCDQTLASFTTVLVSAVPPPSPLWVPIRKQLHTIGFEAGRQEAFRSRSSSAFQPHGRR